MKRNRLADTRPELALRSALWQRGFRFYANRRVAGRRVDIVFPRSRAAIYVDGCFWHGCPEHWSLPKKNRGYWKRKNQIVSERDANDTLELARAGWTVLRFWEHDVLKAPGHAAELVARVVRPHQMPPSNGWKPS